MQNAVTAQSTASNVFGRLGEMAVPVAQAASATASSAAGQKLAKKLPAATKLFNSLSKFGSRSQLATMQHLVDAMIAYAMGVVSGLQVFLYLYKGVPLLFPNSGAPRRLIHFR
jgi:hypothetical protein